MDNKKIIISSYLAVAIVVWFLTRSSLTYLIQEFYRLKTLSFMGPLKEVLPLVFGFGGFFFLLKNSKVNTLLEEVVVELKKVTWPSRTDVVRSTTVVVICVVIATGILAFFDIGFGKLFDFLLKI